MQKNIAVRCECEGTGFVAVADSGGEGVEHFECGTHHPAYQRPSVDEMITHIQKATGLSSIL